MSFANHNILDIALSIIPPTVVQIRKNLGTAVNKFGQVGAAYSAWVEVYGIVQPGGEQNEHVEGMDISKKHVTIWLRGVALDGTHLQWAPDQIRYTDRIFNVKSVDDWFPYDNYRRCECVEVLNLGPDQRKMEIAEIVVDEKTQKVEEPPKPTEPQAPLHKPTIFVEEENKPESKPETPTPVKPSGGKPKIRI